MRRPRYRERVNFWLDLSKDNELVLAEEIDALKSQRRFADAIRDGLRLILDLRRGRVDVLLELFPMVYLAFDAHDAPPEPQAPRRIAAPALPPPDDDDDEPIELDIRAVRDAGSAQNFVNSMEALLR